MEPRAIDVILEEWRERERQLEEYPNADSRRYTPASRRSEMSTQALAKRRAEADEIRRLKP
jgi:hypothetical protein